MEEGTLVAGRYEVRRRLAQGGMAVVLAAHDRRLRRDVALKVARRGDATDRVRFGAEMRLLASLQHPHLVRVFDAGMHQGEAYLVLELADGPTLGQLLGAGPIAEERLVDLGRDIAGALGHLHDRGIIHRDVKPANVLTNADGQWLLADLGIARLVDDTGVTDTGLAVGTPAYLAPEQVAGGCAEPATDVYALGQVLLEAATGQPAFPGGGVEAARARLTQDPDVAAAPVAWQGLLAAMTARDPGDRPSAAEVHERLADVASAVPPVAATGAGTPVLLSTGPVVAPAARHEGAGVDELDASLVAAATASHRIGRPAGGTIGAAPPVDAPRAHRRRGRPRVAVAATVAVLVLAGLAWLRLGSDDATASSPTSTTSSSLAPSTTLAAAAATTPSTAVVAVAEPVTTTVAPTTTTTVATTLPPTTTTTSVAVAPGGSPVVDCPATTTTVAVTEPDDDEGDHEDDDGADDDGADDDGADGDGDGDGDPTVPEQAVEPATADC